MDVCTECQLLYGLCIQSVSCCIDCVYSVSANMYRMSAIVLIVCTECQLLCGCVHTVSAVVCVCVQEVSFCMDVCTECQLLYVLCVQGISCCIDCVYRVLANIWMCVQGVSYCMDCLYRVSVIVLFVCRMCQLLYGLCVQCVSYCMDVCTECQLKSHWEGLQQVGCILPCMLSLLDVQKRKPRLKHSKREENHRLPTLRFASTVLPNFPRISGLVQIRQIKYCNNNKNETAGKTTFL
jgi:hypothetical protein